jgi:hypothetical protein
LTSAVNPSNVQIVANGNGFDVRLSYTYAEELSNKTFSVSVTDHASTNQSTSTFSVADGALTASSTPFSVSQGVAFTNQVATFTDADPKGTISDFTNASTSINWGDGTSSPANGSPVTIAQPGGVGTTFAVSGTHTYQLAGMDTVTVTIMDVGGKTAVTSFTITVGESIVVLNATASGAFTLSGNATANLPGAVTVDSNAKSALTVSGTAQLHASSIQVVGGVSISNNAIVSPTPTTGVSPVADPFVGLAAPSVTGSVSSVNMNSGSTTISPGIYSSIKLAGTASLTLKPGIYVLEGGGLSVTQSAAISGTGGVLIYNAGSNYPGTGGNFGGITLNTTGSVNLTAATSGVVIFQSRDNTRALNINGSTTLAISGTIYAPNALLSISGSSFRASLVVGTLTLSTGANLTQMAAGNAAGNDAAGVPGTLLAGDLYVYITNPGSFAADMLARVQDAINGIDNLLVPYNVTINETSDPTWANVVLDTGTTSASGSAADGVLGSFSSNGLESEITILQGWNWYAGADPTQISGDQYDFQTTVTHELGHALGLGHSPNLTSPMYATLATGTANRSMTVPDLNIPDPPAGTEPQLAAGFHKVDRPPVSLVPAGASDEATKGADQPVITAGFANGLSRASTSVIVGVPILSEPYRKVLAVMASERGSKSQFGPQLAIADLRDKIFALVGDGSAAALPRPKAAAAAGALASGNSGIWNVTPEHADRAGHLALSGDDVVSGPARPETATEVEFAEQAIDWFMVGIAVTAMAFPSQATRHEDTERLFGEWIRRKDGER